jgi:hypothetical protein
MNHRLPRADDRIIFEKQSPSKLILILNESIRALSTTGPTVQQAAPAKKPQVARPRDISCRPTLSPEHGMSNR